MSENHNLNQRLHTFYSATRIPVSLLKSGKITLSYVPIAMDENPAYLYMKKYLQESEGPVYLARQDTLCGILPIDQDMLLLVGPAMATECSSVKCDHIIDDLGLSFKIKRQLLYYLRRVPVISASRFRSNMQMLDILITGSDRLPTAIEQNISQKKSDIDEAPLITTHDTYQMEILTNRAIIEGNVDALEQIWNRLDDSNLSPGMTADSTLENLRNIYIADCAITARAAIAGNVSYDLALSLCDQYIARADTFTDSAEISNAIKNMVMDYTQLVHDLQMPQNASAVTLSAIREIQGNMYKKTEVKDIARKLNISTSYLSHTFHKDMGESLKTYIQKEKILASIRLLNGSDLTLAQIADDLGFSSQAHFQTVFRQYTGHTPLEVREHPDFGRLKEPRGWEETEDVSKQDIAGKMIFDRSDAAQ